MIPPRSLFLQTVDVSSHFSCIYLSMRIEARETERRRGAGAEGWRDGGTEASQRKATAVGICGGIDTRTMKEYQSIYLVSVSSLTVP